MEHISMKHALVETSMNISARLLAADHRQLGPTLRVGPIYLRIVIQIN